MSINIDENNGEGWANLSNCLLKVIVISYSSWIKLMKHSWL